MNPRTVPIPKRMRHLPVDPRGYAIPYLVAVGDDGRARFTVNDENKRQRVIVRDLCSICGQPLNTPRWFCGGPQSAFHEHGAYLDPPMHGDCMRYALTVCPYLALPGYDNVANTRKLADKLAQPLIESTMILERPTVFVVVRSGATLRNYWDEDAYPLADASRIVHTVRPQRPYQRVEYWRHGARLDDATGEAIVRDIMAAPLPDRAPTKLVLPQNWAS